MYTKIYAWAVAIGEVQQGANQCGNIFIGKLFSCKIFSYVFFVRKYFYNKIKANYGMSYWSSKNVTQWQAVVEISENLRKRYL